MGMILNCTECIVSTNSTLADIHAGVGETIAKLVRGAVSIFQAVDFSTTLVVRLANESSRGTSTLGNVVSGNTNCTRSALKSSASRDARFSSLVQPAHFILFALHIAGTPNGQGFRTALPTVRVAQITTSTPTQASVVVCNTL